MTVDGPDLSICDREPIHIPGSIEPNGVLLAFGEPELTARQVSASAENHLGVAAESLLGVPLDKLFDVESAARLRQRATSKDLDGRRHLISGVRFQETPGKFDASLHRHQGSLIIEVEPANEADSGWGTDVCSSVIDALADLEGQLTLVDLCQRVVVNVRRLTGFDRVMVYRFLEDDSGAVIAEDRRDDLTPFLGLRYPASDIPVQARRLYLLNPLRLKADVNATRSPLVPPLNPETGQTLDMTYCVLRAMSPVHDEYLRNMGVMASMSVSIVKNERLWGLIACHHAKPKTVPLHIRATCEILARGFSAHIAAAEQEDTRRASAKLTEYADDLARRLRAAPQVGPALVAEGAQLAAAIGAGIAICMGNEVSLTGDTPTRREVDTIRQWLEDNQREYIFQTEKLSEQFTKAGDSAINVTGLLSARIALGARDFVLWFRPPAVQVVQWAGNPAKPVEETEAGRRISPRLSFERWKETVGDRSAPWLNYERRFALELRHTVAELLLVEQNEQVSRLNLELERSNIELDAFAYATSHDLQEPVRTFRSYSQLLARRVSGRLTNEEAELLRLMETTSIRMGNLISALLHFAHVGGKARREHRPVDLREALQVSMMNLYESIRETGAKISHDSLPVIVGDLDQVTMLLQNLIGNAIKYRKADEAPAVHVSAVREGAMWLFGVHDNGQGFEPQQSGSIFEAFRRLHGKEIPGSGIGLATCRRIVEQHGGKIWAESEGVGRGATFRFTLPGV